MAATEGDLTMPWTKADGHDCEVVRTESGARWLCRCSCGYESRTRATETMAMAAGIHHLTTPDREAAKAAKEARRNGVSTRLSHPTNRVVPGT